MPVSDLQASHKRLEVEKQRNNDFKLRNAKLADTIRKLEKQTRENDEADQKLKVVMEDKENL